MSNMQPNTRRQITELLLIKEQLPDVQAAYVDRVSAWAQDYELRQPQIMKIQNLYNEYCTKTVPQGLRTWRGSLFNSELVRCLLQ